MACILFLLYNKTVCLRNTESVRVCAHACVRVYVRACVCVRTRMRVCYYLSAIALFHLEVFIIIFHKRVTKF